MKPKSLRSLCMPPGRSAATAVAVALSALLANPAHAAVRTWSGTSGVHWSTGGVAGNWTDLAAPVAGDSLTFSTFVNPATNNDLAADTSFVAINFTNTGNAQNFSLSGNRITLGGGINTTASSGTTNTSTDTIALAMILSGDRTITIGARHNLTVTGVISDNGTPRSLLKAGAGTLSLQGANTFSGVAQINEGAMNFSGLNGSVVTTTGVAITGGTITISNTNAGNNTNRLNDSGTFSMAGGVFNFNNNGGAANYSETTGALSLNAGAVSINLGQAAVGQTSTLTFAALARTPGATVNFGGAGLGSDTRNQLLVTANPTLSNNIIGGWATVGAVDWASYDAINGVIALPSASYTVDTWTAGNNTTVTNSTSPASGSETHTLRFNLPAADILTLAGANTITGGILVTAGVAANISTITGGTLQGPAGGELIIHQHNPTVGNGLTIGSIIQDNTSASSLVKTGGGTVMLTGTNTYTGGTVINSGSLVLNNAAGEAIQGPVTLSGAGRIVLGNSNQVSDTTVITFASGNNSARINLTNVAGTGFSETVAGIADAADVFSGSRIIEAASDGVAGSPGVLTINTAGQNHTFGGLVRDAAGTAPGSTLSIIKEGTGIQTFSGAAVTYTGTTTVKAGTLKFSGGVINSSTVSLEGGTVEFAAAGTRSTPITSTVSTGGVLKSGTGNLIFTADNTYTGTTTVNNGTLQLNRSGGTIADTATVAVTTDTAILNIAQSDTIATLNLALAATVSGAGTLTVNTLIAPNIAVNKINTISASLAGTAQLKKTGQGTTILSAANSYSGGTWLNGANSKLTISGSGTLGSTSGTLLIDTAGTVLDLGATSQTVGAITLTAGTIQNGTLTGSSYSIAAGTVSAVLAGPGVALSKTTGGTATLSGINTYTGDTTVSEGVLAINGTSIADTNKLIIDGGTVDLTGAETVNTLFFGAVQQAMGTYSSDGAGGTIANTNFTGTGTLIVTTGPAPVSGYASWMAPFITGGLTGDTTATGDPDNDGMKNLLEYALNGNPGTSDSSILPDLVVTATDFEFTYSRLDLSLVDTVQTFEYGSNLTGWTPILVPAGPGVSTVGIATVTVTDTGSTDSVKVSIRKSAAGASGKLFGRLQVVK